jgi:hypothetical protein
VRAWFAPAFAPDEVLVAALASSTYRLTLFRSLLATGMALIGQNPARILLLTDRSLHLAARKFTRRRFKKLVVSYPLHSVTVTWDKNLVGCERRGKPRPHSQQSRFSALGHATP